jgi:predicted Zn-dependent peptidase
MSKQGQDKVGTHKVSVVEFPNKFRLVHQRPSYDLPVSNIHLFVHAGSANEDAKTRGASHFIEHMCFKGTKKHPHSVDIMRKFDYQGAYFNAHTVKQYTCYDIKCTDDTVAEFVRILADVMFHSVFDRAEYKKELAVVIEENIKDVVDYSSRVTDLLEARVFEGSVYEHPIDTIKYHKTPDSLDYDNVLRFYHKYYVPSNMLLSITTNIPIGTMTQMTKRCEFGVSNRHCLNTSNTLSVYPVLRERLEPCVALTHIPRIHSANVALGFRVCSFMHEDAIVLHFLENVLGGRMTSRVFTLLREENGLTYSSDVDTTHYEPAGVFYVFAISDSNKLIKAPSVKKNSSSSKKGVVPLLVDMFNDLYEKGITHGEWMETRRYLEKKVNILVEDADNMAYTNGKRVLLRNLKKVVAYQDMYAHFYSKVTMADIHRVIRTYFTRANSYLAIVGGDLPEERVLNKFMNGLPAR